MTAINDVAIQSDGKIVAVGYLNDALPSNHNIVVSRYDAKGDLDTSFGVGGRVTIDFGRSSIARAVAIAGNGDIIVAGGVSGTGGGGAVSSDVAVARLNSNGALDTTFSDDGMVITDVGTAGTTPDTGVDVGIDGIGRIVVGVHNDSDQGGGWTLVRYLRGGAVDNSFASGGVLTEVGGTLNAINVLDNGKILAAGELDEACSGGVPACTASSATIIRYTAGGARDLTFGAGGVAVNSFQSTGAQTVMFTDLAMQKSKIIAVGLSQTSSRNDVIVARFNKNGIRDNTFVPPTTLLPDDRTARSGSNVKVAVQLDNKVVLGMTSATLAGNDQNFAVMRLTKNGGIDNSFNANGLTNIEFDDQLSTLHSLALQKTTGRIILAGRAFDVSPGNPELASAALAALEGFKGATGPDRSPPRAILVTHHPDTRGAQTRIVVRYIDDHGIDRTTLDNHDILVSGPNGFSQLAKLVRIRGSKADTRATYSIDAPGGNWNRADEGRYSITLQQRQVQDTAGHFAPPTELGRFRVQFPPRT